MQNLIDPRLSSDREKEKRKKEKEKEREKKKKKGKKKKKKKRLKKVIEMVWPNRTEKEILSTQRDQCSSRRWRKKAGRQK